MCIENICKWTVPFQLAVGYVDLGRSLKINQLDQQEALSSSYCFVIESWLYNQWSLSFIKAFSSLW